MLGRGRGGEGMAGERFRLTRIADALATMCPRLSVCVCVCLLLAGVCLLLVRAKAKIKRNKYGATRSAGDYRRKVQLARLCALGGKDMV